MLYILPPPSAKPPSVWDLIINFHRKGCQESGSSAPSPKKSLKFDCRETKSQRTWCKTSPSNQSHVSQRFSWPQKRSVSLSRENQTDGHEENFFRFPPKTRLDFPVRFPSSLARCRDEYCCGKWNAHTWREESWWFKNSFSPFSPFGDEGTAQNKHSRKNSSQFLAFFVFFILGKTSSTQRCRWKSGKHLSTKIVQRWNHLMLNFPIKLRGKPARHWTANWATSESRPRAAVSCLFIVKPIFEILTFPRAARISRRLSCSSGNRGESFVAFEKLRSCWSSKYSPDFKVDAQNKNQKKFN